MYDKRLTEYCKFETKLIVGVAELTVSGLKSVGSAPAEVYLEAALM